MASKKRKAQRQAQREALPLVEQPAVNDTEMGRGVIKDNALKAAVTSKLFTTRVVIAKKGKGSYNRKTKFKGREPYSMPLAA